MDGIFLLLGTNMMDRLENLKRAHILIQREMGMILEKSKIYETEAWGVREQNTFLNQVIKIQTTKSAEELLELIGTIERDMGRVRVGKWLQRIIDIDILYYGDQIHETPELTVPHRLIPNRRFVLVPMNEVASEFIHPVLKKDQQELLSECQDPLEVKLFKENPQD